MVDTKFFTSNRTDDICIAMMEGFNVFIDSKARFTEADIYKIQQTSIATGARLYCGIDCLFTPAVTQIKQFVDESCLGNVRSITATSHMVGLSHLIDTIDFFMGELPPMTITNDKESIVIKYPYGRIATIYSEPSTTQMTIFCENGSIAVNNLFDGIDGNALKAFNVATDAFDNTSESFYRSQLIASCLNGETPSTTNCELMWKNLGLKDRVQNYGYPHKYKDSDGNVIKTEFFDNNTLLTNFTPDNIPSHVKDMKSNSAFICLFDKNGNIYMTDLRERGYDIPGGKKEGDETPIQVGIRELEEETGIKVDPDTVKYCGRKYLEATHELHPDFKYPAIACFDMFYAVIDEITDTSTLQTDNTTKGVVKLSRDEYVKVPNWMCHRQFYEYARSKI